MPVDHDAVLSWYAAVRRDLPWRRTRDPYRILVSEVMLQQTQVVRVVPYYEAFLDRFPDEQALGSAPTADVLRLWSGLGYNRRALALQACARAVAQDGWPPDAAGLRSLPGIGPYTAAAVASFAFGEQVAAVDTNVKRVIERIDREHRTARPLDARAQELLPAGRAADWNQAMMELGATVCGARAATCGDCPVAGCRSRGRPLPPSPVSRRPRGAERFEQTDRFVRGRIVAALAAGEPLPPGIAAERIERALAGLERDGLVVRDGESVRLP
ncbi:A/G-specific adenine glycosylase [Conexibacter stalactiti]|uniref:A/G-specific adenine glycosylase n=1 Tax=Conexibacter stalactiti TaxID=1940611 RepID=A0ABU4HRL5_9ACTN|nr:A/G-specific adenine glycosylase [Conexibacter stalactiti]MDW5595953.1 A/G-specific adenine glycosylase [Conexibacter stalactiti]MEC5036595.1 A/G-specific adenine glycosylase [Conexibacter stalactiti]